MKNGVDKGKSSSQLLPQDKKSNRARSSRSAVAAIVSESRARAEVYVKHPKMLQDLINEATQKMAMLDKGVFKDSWVYLLAMVRLLKAYTTRRYKEISQDNVLSVVIAVAYFVSPLDLIPDFVEGAGYLDDAMIVRAVQRNVRPELEHFMEWESGIAR